ncbi:MAG: hypothetical protein QOD99_1291 [Chthoniobacter sp.]|nr:hypothetical protein [Chthoniobacter sp.]
MRRLLPALLWAGCCWSSHAADFIKGITISAQTWGEEWATPQMAAALDEVKALGANAIAIHPYARIQTDGSLQFSSDPEPDYITKPLDWARERGLRVMLVPHIAYWGSPWLWRGEIDFAKIEGWRRFFSDYEKWMTQMARLAQEHGAETLCVGLEYSHAVKFDARWRQIIASARREFHGKIVYGANWDTVGEVPFWDAVDYIGVLAYFPLTKAENPSARQIETGWRPWMEKLGALSRQYGKPVLFTEIGYNENERAAVEPWDFHHQGNANAATVQARCVEEALQMGGHYPFLAGMFWWKWYPDLPMDHAETFDLRTPVLKKLIAKYWADK